MALLVAKDFLERGSSVRRGNVPMFVVRGREPSGRYVAPLKERSSNRRPGSLSSSEQGHGNMWSSLHAV